VCTTITTCQQNKGREIRRLRVVEEKCKRHMNIGGKWKKIKDSRSWLGKKQRKSRRKKQRGSFCTVHQLSLDTV